MLRHRLLAPCALLAAGLHAGGAHAYTVESQTLWVATDSNIEAPYCSPPEL